MEMRKVSPPANFPQRWSWWTECPSLSSGDVAVHPRRKTSKRRIGAKSNQDQVAEDENKEEYAVRDKDVVADEEEDYENDQVCVGVGVILLS
mmetsp:Transcript_25046/g.62948  ORF Transcript_25046/g.62948 Transcript_25046/m.62948 type:complete len:92 (-) Transcript_25046:3-278(-)